MLREENESPGKSENPGNPDPQYLVSSDLSALASVWPGPIDRHARLGEQRFHGCQPSSLRTLESHVLHVYVLLPLVTFFHLKNHLRAGLGRQLSLQCACHLSMRLYIKARPVPIIPGLGNCRQGGLLYLLANSSIQISEHLKKKKKKRERERPVRLAELR